MIEALTGQEINVRHACLTLGVSESGYYAWKDRPTSPRALRRMWLAAEIATVHKASGGTYGAHRVTAELKHGRGIKVGHNAVELIMRELGIKGLPTRRLPKGAKVGKVTSLDLVRREFRRGVPDHEPPAGAGIPGSSATRASCCQRLFTEVNIAMRRQHLRVAPEQQPRSDRGARLRELEEEPARWLLASRFPGA